MSLFCNDAEGEPMATTTTRLHLHPSYFGDRERLLLEQGEFSARAFRYESGVAGLLLSNGRCQLTLLPFHGQQIWRFSVDGRELTMRSTFDEPRATRVYLENYGGFLLHCGITAMGVPGPGDTHPLHGELPNAPFQHAVIVLGSDAGGEYIALRGRYQHTVAFSTNYAAEPFVKLYAGATTVDIDLLVTNLLENAPLELMYLAHLNFRPVDNARLAYSARVSPETVRVRASIPPHVKPSPEYRAFLAELSEHPERHHTLEPGLSFNPEVVFNIDYLADADGWAHTLQLHPDGQADYVAHRPEQLGVGVRWICRTGDKDALGLALPATAGPEGYTVEKAKGLVQSVPPGGAWTCAMRAGALDAAAAREAERRIGELVDGA
jgi:hypothetical protein